MPKKQSFLSKLKQSKRENQSTPVDQPNLGIEIESTEHIEPGPATGGAIYRDHWKEYFDIGLFPYPMEKDRKKPEVNLTDQKTGEWIEYGPTHLEQWSEKFANSNIMARLGPYKGVLDPDGDQAEAFVKSLTLPKYPTSISGNRSIHRFFKVTTPFEAFRIKFGKDDFLEVRTGNLLVTVPPSVHPETRKPYQWEEGLDPWTLGGFEELPREILEKLQAMSIPKMTKPFASGEESKFGKLDIERYLSDFGIEISRVKQRGSFTIFELKHCLWGDEHGHGDLPGDSAIFQGPEGQLGFSCFHNSCEGRGWADARQVISGDDPIYKFCEGYDPNYQGSDRASSNGVHDEPPKKDSIPWPSPLPDLAFYGIAGELAREIEPNSESDPVAILIQCLTVAGNAVGPGPHYRVESDNHQLKLFPVLVGETSKARKGTAWGYIRDTFKQIVEVYDESLNFKSGLSSGEGLVWHVRDPITKHVVTKDNGMSQYTDEITDPGVKDKRLLVLEPEFASILKVMGRDGNILSPVIRQAWDGDVLQGMSKNSPVKATGAHISIIGHITRRELIRYLDRTECGNGFGNRFLYVCVKRSKILPEGGNFRISDGLLAKFRHAFEFGKIVGRITKDAPAQKIWNQEYEKLSEGRPGLHGEVTSRAEAYVNRIACIYAVLDLSPVIKEEHLFAALAVWHYADRSAKYIFGDATGDRIADRIIRGLKESPTGKLSRTEISNLFQRNEKSDKIDQALSFLKSLGRVRMIQESTEGRSFEWWSLV